MTFLKLNAGEENDCQHTSVSLRSEIILILVFGDVNVSFNTESCSHSGGRICSSSPPPAELWSRGKKSEVWISAPLLSLLLHDTPHRRHATRPTWLCRFLLFLLLSSCCSFRESTTAELNVSDLQDPGLDLIHLRVRTRDTCWTTDTAESEEGTEEEKNNRGWMIIN